MQKDSILWLKTIADSVKRFSVTLITEDKTGECAVFSLYNQVDPTTTFKQLQKVFPKGVNIGLKNPYMKIQKSGMMALRNDNP